VPEQVDDTKWYGSDTRSVKREHKVAERGVAFPVPGLKRHNAANVISGTPSTTQTSVATATAPAATCDPPGAQQM